MKNSSPSTKALTIKQQRFCELFVSGISATQSYLDAGYACSRSSARSNGAELRKNPAVAAYIAGLRAPDVTQAILTKDMKLRYLAELIRTPIGHIGPDSPFCQEYVETVQADTGPRGRLRDVQNPAKDEAVAPPRKLVRVKMADKLRAIELHSKLAGDFEPEKIVMEAGGGTLDALRQRAENIASALDRVAAIKQERQLAAP